MSNDLSTKVFNDRYALRDENGNQVETTPEEMYQRVSRGAVAVEKPESRNLWQERFYNLLSDFKFVPGGRILSGVGGKIGVSFYNCFVIPSPEDSRGGIMDSVKLMSEIMSRGGGVGVNISSLRPRGSRVKGVNGTASGSVSFGGLYSYATGLITQGGSRRGALMLVLDASHPDIEEFITAKKTAGVLTNANLSVAIPDEFMEAIKNDADWDLKWNGEVIKTVKASYLWNIICESAHASGEPGVVFLDRANKLSNTWYHDKIISTNPCGEQPLPAWGVCNLGSVNLSAFVKDGVFNEESLGGAVRDAVRFLDNVIDLNQYHFKENETTQKAVRRIGLGTMGLADMLIKLKIRYGSEEALEFVDELYRFIRDEAYAASVALAKEKGVFPAFDSEKFIRGKFIESLPVFLKDAIAQYGIRNATLLTQAPTGTISILADTSSGIEPIYDFCYTRKDRIGEHVVCHPLYKDYRDAHPDEELPPYFITAKELPPEEHIKMQAAIQKYVDASISKTVNAPNEHALEDVKKMYTLAYELGCKGVTYYRDGSRDESVLTSIKDEKSPRHSIGFASGEKEAKSEEKMAVAAGGVFGQLKPKDRPRIMTGETYKVPMGYGNMYVTINNDEEGRPFEVFARIGKTGGFFEAKAEAICRLVSLALRSGINVKEIIGQIKGIRGPMPSWGENGMILSIPDGIAQTLEEHISKEQQKLNLEFGDSASAQAKKEAPEKIPVELSEPKKTPEEIISLNLPAAPAEPKNPDLLKEMFYQKTANYAKFADIGEAPECPGCGSMLEFAEGCLICRGCGYSKCA